MKPNKFQFRQATPAPRRPAPVRQSIARADSAGLRRIRKWRGTDTSHGLAFTLIEVCTVVVILSILAAVVLPGLGNDDSLGVAAASQIVVSDLLYAQNLAIATQSPVSVSFTVSGNGVSGGYAIYNATPFGTPVTNPTTQLPYVVQFGSNAQTASLARSTVSAISLAAASDTVLVFDELGRPQSCTAGGTAVALGTIGTITLQCGSASSTIRIEAGTGDLSVSP